MHSLNVIYLLHLVIYKDDWVEISNKMYYFSTEKKTFNDASMFCKSEANEAKLFEPKTMIENRQVSSMAVSKGGINDFWIGLKFQEDKFAYESDKTEPKQKKVTYFDETTTFWAPQQPDCLSEDGNCGNYCVQRNHEDELLWDDISCNEERSFVCQKDVAHGKITHGDTKVIKLDTDESETSTSQTNFKEDIRAEAKKKYTFGVQFVTNDLEVISASSDTSSTYKMISKEAQITCTALNNPTGNLHFNLW